MHVWCEFGQNKVIVLGARAKGFQKTLYKHLKGPSIVYKTVEDPKAFFGNHNRFSRFL